jgi:molybdate transport system substrate-binding protein
MQSRRVRNWISEAVMLLHKLRRLILSVMAPMRVLLALCIALGTLQASAADLMVAAASSLTNAFQDIGKEYEKANPGIRVLFNFGASGQLLQQISRGAPVDVFASADAETMDRAEKQNLIFRDSRANFAANKLFLIIPGDSTLQLSSLADLAAPAVKKIALGNPDSVPVGRYSKAAMEKAGVWESLLPKFVYAQNVRQSLDYVFRGEVEAGFVYGTDAAVSPVKVRVAMEVPTESPIVYPIAVVKGYGSENRARSFVAFVRSEAGQKVLDRYGFKRP